MNNKMLAILLLANIFILVESKSVMANNNTTTAPVSNDDKTNGLIRNGYSTDYSIYFYLSLNISIEENIFKVNLIG